MNPIAQGDPLIEGVTCWGYVILTVAWHPLANTFVQASGGMSATTKVLVYFSVTDEKMFESGASFVGARRGRHRGATAPPTMNGM